MSLTPGRDEHRVDDADGLRAWLADLPGGPSVTETVVLVCPQHGDERVTWTYVEADAAAGVARRRCLACGFAVSVLDSAARWTYPPMWACRGCRHSIAEVAAGLAVPDGEHVQWVVLAARCVECGLVAGLTDLVVPDRPRAEVVSGL